MAQAKNVSCENWTESNWTVQGDSENKMQQLVRGQIHVSQIWVQQLEDCVWPLERRTLTVTPSSRTVPDYPLETMVYLSRNGIVIEITWLCRPARPIPRTPLRPWATRCLKVCGAFHTSGTGHEVFELFMSSEQNFVYISLWGNLSGTLLKITGSIRQAASCECLGPRFPR